jgi:DNA-binding transcriptional regulator YiaG
MPTKRKPIDHVSVTLTIPAALLCAFIGTGGTYASELTDRIAKPQLVTSSALSNESSDKEKFDGKAKRQFQEESKIIQETFSLTVTQYAALMGTTRATVYKWHNLNMPLTKVRSTTLNRFKKLQNALSVVKIKNQNYFGEWLRNPIEPSAQKANLLLKAESLSQDDFIELSKELNISIRKYSDIKKLNKTLGIA